MKSISKFFFSKPVLFLVLTFMFQPKGHCQITLDAQIDSSAYPALWRMVQISATETKYFFPDTVNNTFSLLNMDFTPFMTNIAVPNPWGWTTARHYEAYYITRDLFDCDTSNIEFVFAAPTSAVTPFRILRTDGTELFRLDSAIAFFCAGDCGNGGSDYIPPIINTSAGAKLTLSKFNSGNEVDYVYSLCGRLPEVFIDFNNISSSYVTLYPNPSAGLLKFEINVPDNLNEYELAILDCNGKEIKRVMGKDLGRIVNLDAENFINGAYFYSLCTKNKKLQTGKFIINRLVAK